MQVIKDDLSLAQAIREKENQQRAELNLLKTHFDYTIEHLNPVNIIKEKFSETVSSIGETVTSESFKTKALKIGVGLASGFLTKKLIVGSSGGFFKKLFANVFSKIKFRTEHYRAGCIDSQEFYL